MKHPDDGLDFAALMGPVARRLLGEPNAALSSDDELRFGTHGSVSVRIAGDGAGTWYDHEGKAGGGVLDLVARERRLVNGEALDWIRAEFAGEAPLPKPAPTGRRPKLGRLLAAYDYRGPDGALLFQVTRHEPKDFRQRQPDGAGGWTWRVKGLHLVPYRLPELLASPPTDPVFVVEGEKDADALAGLGLVATCNPGGAGKWLATFGEHLRGREVVVLPDNDATGADHGRDVVRRLTGVAARVRVLALPGLPPKGDVSDWLATGGTRDALLQLAAEIPDAVPKPAAEAEVERSPDEDGTTWPPGYVVRDDGLFFLPLPKRDSMTGEETAGTPMRLAAPFRILGEARDAAGHGRALLLLWTDADGREQRFPLPRRMLHGDHGALAGELEDRGLRVRTGPIYRGRLADALAGVRTSVRISSADRSGWHRAGGAMAYLLADGTALGNGGERVLLTGAGGGAAERVAASGTLEGWQAGVAAPAVGNHRLALFVAASFAPPLLEVLGIEGGGIHLLGGSSTGKSTALEAAASAWGSPRMGQQVRSWRATANALEGAAVECSDAPLCLDEIGLADGKDVGTTMYTLAGGAGRGRADRTGALRASRTWRTLFLSTGEVSPADKIAETGGRSRAGQDVRCVSIPADTGHRRGVWQVLHGQPDGEALSNAVKAAALAHHGHAARAFLAALVRMRAEKPADLLRSLGDGVAAFTRGEHVPAEADGQVKRVAQRFGLIAAAGELATELGILPWPEGEATRAAAACFAAWLAGRGGHGAAEARNAVEAVRAFIGAHGSSRFSLLVPSTEQDGEREEDSNRPVQNRAGWRRRTAEGWEYMILPEAWRGEVCRGLDPMQVAREVDEAGLLRRGEGKNLAAFVRIPGEGRPRLFVLKPGLLAEDGP